MPRTNLPNFIQIVVARIANIPAKRLRGGLVAFGLTGFCIVALFHSMSFPNQTASSSTPSSSSSGEHAASQSNVPDALPKAKANPSALLPSGLTGMSAVELHVRESSFLQGSGSKASLPAAAYDLYFLYQDEKARSRAEVVFRNIVLQSMDPGANRIEILIPEQDVATMLALEMMGEYQIVRRSLRGNPANDEENLRQQGGSSPLSDREWVKTLVGDESVVVVP